jgi:isocitrate dehydrogenase (NAD+)
MFRKRSAAKELTGLNLVNPTATLYAGAEMLSTMGYPRFSKLIETAVTNVYLEGKVLTQDVGGKATTDQFTDRVIQEITLLNENSVKF